MTVKPKSSQNRDPNALDHGGGPTRAVRQMPEPARFWIAHVPRSWRFATEPWTDLARARLGGYSKPALDLGLPDFDFDGIDDLFYVPPVHESLAAERDQLAAALVEADVPALVQLRPGETCDVDGVYRVYDLLPTLLNSEIEAFLSLPEDVTVVWPLLPGISDHSEMWDDGCHLLRRAGVVCVQPLLVELDGKQRRHLAEGRGEDVFDALFHGSEPSEHRFAQVAAEHDMPVFMPRPETGVNHRMRTNRRLAASLAMAGELSLRLDEVGQGQALLRAARGAESTQHDLAALAREGNLRVMDWLDVHGIELLEEMAHRDRSDFLGQLQDRYLGRADAEDQSEDE